MHKGMMRLQHSEKIRESGSFLHLIEAENNSEILLTTNCKKYHADNLSMFETYYIFES